MKHRDYDVIVVGGGHAGVEAALAAARMERSVALVTQKTAGIGVMSCNPAIGGIGKGHIVREIDALDGIMGRAADAAGIQYRLLNRSKGPATQGPRTQADRDLYRAAIARAVAETDVAVIEAEVTDLITDAGEVAGVVTRDGVAIRSRSVVLTTGTFLNGVIHMGLETRSAGRVGDEACVALARRISDLGLPLGRLKTGTPPRLAGRSIDWGALEAQAADDDPEFLSFLTGRVQCRQVSCGMAHTNSATHDIIRKNLGKTVGYGGTASGVGPRYCPSIEDKVVRFAEKSSHQVFLEPEGLSTDLVYPNGISTSLPAEVQLDYVRSMEGLSRAVIVQPGYAIEYDYVDPRSLDRTLQVKAMPGLYLAGQINGTTGYEEAAGQGLLAGLNAACRSAGEDPIILQRSESYIGVMADDLVTNGVTEPYRMFTSRAEYRLELRADNADQRLTPLGMEYGCVGSERRISFEEKMSRLSDAMRVASDIRLTPREATRLGIPVTQDGVRRNLIDLAPHVEGGFVALAKMFEDLQGVKSSILAQIDRESVYRPYLERQAKDVERLKRDEGVALPSSLDYGAMPGLSNELREKLGRIRPSTLGQAGRVEGMTPAALTLVLLHARQAERV